MIGFAMKILGLTDGEILFYEQWYLLIPNMLKEYGFVGPDYIGATL